MLETNLLHLKTIVYAKQNVSLDAILPGSPLLLTFAPEALDQRLFLSSLWGKRSELSCFGIFSDLWV